MLRLLGILVTVLFAIAAAVVTWPQFFRLERAFPFTQLVSMRGLLVLACAAIVLVALLMCIARPIRAFAGAILTIALVAGLANAGVIYVRGAGSDRLPESSEAGVRVMTWNTAGSATDPTTIAQTAVAMQADIVALPETTIETGEQVAIAMRELGRPMWAHHDTYEDLAGYEEWDANSTTLLISPDLGDYAVIESTEAVGLWRERRWAEYLTVVATAGFLPFEIRELLERVTPLRVAAIVVNLAILVYLVYAKRLFGVRGGAAALERQVDWEAILASPVSLRKTPLKT